MVVLKDPQLNKLRAAVSFRPMICMNLFQIEFKGVPDCFTKNGLMYNGEKSNTVNVLKDHPPSTSPTLKATSLVIDFHL